MRLMQHQWPLLALAAWLGVVGIVLSTEPDAEQKIGISAPYPSRRSKDEAYGLLVNRYRTSAAERVAQDIGAPDDNQSEAEIERGHVQATSWLTSEGEGPPAALPQAANDSPSYLTGSEGCSSCQCCNPLWCYRNSVFVDFLYLRPGNIDYIYAVEQTGSLPTDSPTGPVG